MAVETHAICFADDYGETYVIFRRAEHTTPLLSLMARLAIAAAGFALLVYVGEYSAAAKNKAGAQIVIPDDSICRSAPN